MKRLLAVRTLGGERSGKLPTGGQASGVRHSSLRHSDVHSAGRGGATLTTPAAIAPSTAEVKNESSHPFCFMSFAVKTGASAR